MIKEAKECYEAELASRVSVYVSSRYENWKLAGTFIVSTFRCNLLLF
jgi:hypothetical protein